METTYKSTTIKRGNCTVTIHRPTLDEKERSRRENIALNALTNFGKHLIHKRGIKNERNQNDCGTLR